MLNELKFALRKLRRAPGFTTVAILTIAIAVGANTAILSIADAVLFKPLPYRDPDRVFLLQMRNPADGRMFTNVSLDYVKRLDEHHQGLSAAGTFEGLGRSLETMTPAGVEFVPMVVTSASYFDVLGIRPQLGRLFTAADYADRERPLVLSDASWRSRFAADRGIVGRRVSFGSRSFDVIGVLPRDFVMPSNFGGKPEVFLLQEPPTKPGGGTFHPIFRLEPGVSREQAQTEINALIGPLLNLGGDARQAMPWLLEIGATIYPTGRAIMGFLLAAALMVLLLAAANLGNLMLTRGRQAERQTAVQMALGASRIGVVRPIVIEALIIGLAGSALAIAINAAMFDSLASMVPSVAYGNAHIGVSTRVGALALALGLAASVLFALVPAWRASRLDVQALVQQRSAGGSPRARLGRPMIALQVAVAVILLFGAIVASRAFVAILRTPLGFTPDRVVTVGVSLPRDRADVRAFYTAVRDAVASVAGVQYAGASGSLPLSSSAAPWTTATRPGGTDGVGVIHVLPGYFEAAGLIVQRGRTLTDTSTPAEIVLSASAARSLFGTADPLGQTVTDGRTDTWQIVGVVNDVRNSIDRNTPAVGYAVPGGRTTTLAVVARTVARTGTLDQDIAAAVRAIAPRSRVTVRWWEDVIADTTAYKNPRFQTSVLSSFAAIALALTVLGLFGLVSYVVAARTREFGIRLAIGASPRSLVALTMRQMLVPVSVGILGGLIATRWLAQLAEAQLFKVETRDPGTLAIAVIVVVIAAMIAAYLPARRAERVDPLIALRTE